MHHILKKYKQQGCLIKTQMKKATETKDLEPSLFKAKPKAVKEPIKPKPIKANLIDDVNYKAILFTKPKKIMPLKMRKKMQNDDAIFI